MTAQHDATKVFETAIIVRETRAIHQGQQGGKPFTLYQIVATKPDGKPIDLNLRAFEDLPRDEVMPVEVTPFVSEQYGTSYTIKPKAKSRQSLKIEELEERLAAVERAVGLTPNSSSSVPAGPPAPPQPERQAPPPPPPVQRHPSTEGGGNAF